MKKRARQYQMVVTDQNRRLVSAQPAIAGRNLTEARRNARKYLKRLRARIGAELDKAAERSR